MWWRGGPKNQRSWGWTTTQPALKPSIVLARGAERVDVEVVGSVRPSSSTFAAAAEEFGEVDAVAARRRKEDADFFSWSGPAEVKPVEERPGEVVFFFLMRAAAHCRGFLPGRISW